jgi:glutamyl-tRNA synthetase
MNDNTMRVRFAPSPTGYLHVGGARTALFNWLLARRTGGVFILRIEDTDRERSNAEMTEVILDSLTWLGLDWDEGPFFQADGLERHQRDARSLLHAGMAYRCFCTAEQVALRRARAGAVEAAGYDRFCRSVPLDESAQRAAAGQPFAIRFLVPAGATEWDDAIHGSIRFANEDIEDFVVLRSDGTPVYNMAVVSDDIAMRVTHVLRGDDHISNTPKQILLYQALSRPLPIFGHVPLILGPDGKRLSKRHGATAVGEYRRQGFLPVAMVNFLALLGWSPGTDEEVFTLEQLIERFSLDGINRKSAIFDVQKLLWLNSRHLALLPPAELAARVAVVLEQRGLATRAILTDRPAWFHALLELLKPRSRTLEDFAIQAAPFLANDVVYGTDAVDKHWRNAEEVTPRMEALRDRFAHLDVWDHAAIENSLRRLAEEQGIAAGKLIHPLRLALTGSAVGPGVFDVAVLLGRERSVERIDAAIAELGRAS